MKLLLLILALSPLYASANSLPDIKNNQLKQNLTERGAGEFRHWGFHIYDIKLWGSKEMANEKPYALQITYKKTINASRIVDASIDEMDNLELGYSEQELKNWQKTLSNIFPDVKPEDVITGVNFGTHAEFYLNNQAIGRIQERKLVTAFFNIWLHENTSRPDLRALLLQTESS